VWETPEELLKLQSLLDASYDSGGPHLKDTITPERRLSAEELMAWKPEQVGLLDDLDQGHYFNEVK
jgi:hypothetical protein